ncbi:MAG: N-6 DNA methylase, partial [Parafilimonas sp.]|nr:N-6 DNA methylase [Parafilimonas sp.]
MALKEEAYKEIENLVSRFEEQLPSYKKSDYNEALVRRDFIDPFFKALGWDINNTQGYAEAYREVIHEDRLKVSGANKAPDYSFRLPGGKRLFFVEAKKPSVNIKEEVSPAYQVRRYGWSAKLPVSIVTDFEEFALYDCIKKPVQTDKASTARIKYFTYKDYTNQFDFLWDTFSKEKVLRGGLDKFIATDKIKKGTATVDKEFLNSLDEWRKELALNIALRNEVNNDELNFVVQALLDRLIFFRIAEDRNIEAYGSLKDCTIAIGGEKNGVYTRLMKLFTEADSKYNSGIFNFKQDRISKLLEINNKTLSGIIKQLYYPESPYEFSVINVEILGSAYEQFLGKQIILKGTHKATIEEKPEVRKAGGVYYTPQYIVDYIVDNTVGKLIENKTPEQVEKLKIVDPACGSGSFLLGAYDKLLKWYHAYHQPEFERLTAIAGSKNYNSNDRNKAIRDRNKLPFTPDGRLTTKIKKKILTDNIYGVDIDTNAVEVTKLSLLLKCLEDETQSSINAELRFGETVLPSLENNIKCGNSLIDVDFYEQFPDADTHAVKPFNWKENFAAVFKQGGFDVVIGNPPYVRIHEFDDSLKNYYKEFYRSASNQFDLYQLFYEKGIKLLNEKGILSFITSNKFCITNYGKALRDIIFKETTIINIVDCSTANVFGKVSTYPFIFFLGKNYAPDNNVLLMKNEKDKFLEQQTVSQSKLLKGSEEIFSFDLFDFAQEIVEKIEKQKSLNTHTVYRGRGTTKDLQDNKSGIKSVTNKEVLRYEPLNHFYFKKINAYENDFLPKILMKKICFNLECNIDLNGDINPINTVYVIQPIEKISIKYLLGIFNSTLLTFYARKKYLTTGMRGGYIELRVFEVEKLPIKLFDAAKTKTMINLVETMLQLNQQLQQTTLPQQQEQIKQR